MDNGEKESSSYAHTAIWMWIANKFNFIKTLNAGSYFFSRLGQMQL